ncbi:hypothetical protein AYO20_00704 [Fonsecaea nubica]|uniref:Uncharacterized protein n=1 Tax=Fonsecaea nubica TaxID=856822 RepID=A0A178DDQ5_9EURO|nr:hypothetical protein AYO20_00704 [Fonsecaea nubica]OAL39792.1 hypothetical protein AYO20_00704 [Fonsecaea nubica]
MHFDHRLRPDRYADEHLSDDELQKPLGTRSDHRSRPASKQEFCEKEESRSTRDMGIDVSVNGVGKWVEVPNGEINVADIDCIIISQQLALDLVRSPQQYEEKLKPLERPHTVNIDGGMVQCHGKLRAVWRWVGGPYSHEADLFVTSELNGRCKFLLPPLQERSSEVIPSLKPLYSVVLTDEEVKRQKEHNDQANTAHHDVVEASSKRKSEKFAALIKGNENTQGQQHQGQSSSAQSVGTTT